MLKSLHKVRACLCFESMSLDKVAALETFIREGFDGKESYFGEMELELDIKHNGNLDMVEEKKTKSMTKEKLLDLEKKHGTKGCGQ